ncbi:hypothetical protein ACT7DF_14885 [Bacillus cereus]
MQAEKGKNINQMKKEERKNLGVRDRKGNQEQERVKEVALQLKRIQN